MECSIRSSSSSSVVPVRASSLRFFESPLPTNINLSKLKRPLAKRMMVRNACEFDQNGSVEGSPCFPSKVFMEEAIGAEYGEGFETFRKDGLFKVDVDFLNQRLQDNFLQRVRHAMKPDEAFGLIFSWDNVVADNRALKLNAWKQLASEEGEELPKDNVILKQILNSGADYVLNKILSWKKTETEVDALKQRLTQLYYDNLLQLDKPLEGLQEWLEAVSTARIPCAVASNLDRKNMIEALERMSIKKYFQAFVTEEDDMDSMAHRFLSAAVKLDRKPSKCVVFEDDPRGVTAAHNCTMMAVALIGVHPAYDLRQADLAVASFNDLSVINLRRMFAHRGLDFMDLEKQIVEKSPPKRKLSIDTIF